jgi:hypothetical protein
MGPKQVNSSDNTAPFPEEYKEQRRIERELIEQKTIAIVDALLFDPTPLPRRQYIGRGSGQRYYNSNHFRHRSASRRE